MSIGISVDRGNFFLPHTFNTHALLFTPIKEARFKYLNMPTDNKISVVKNKGNYIYLGIIRIAIWEMQISIDGTRYSVFLQNGSCMYNFKLPRALVITTFVSQELGLVLAKVNLCFNEKLVVVSAAGQFRSEVCYMECYHRSTTWSITWNVTISLQHGLLHRMSPQVYNVVFQKTQTRAHMSVGLQFSSKALLGLYLRFNLAMAPALIPFWVLWIYVTPFLFSSLTNYLLGREIFLHFSNLSTLL